MADTWGKRLFTAVAIVLLLAGLVHSLSFFEKPVPANDKERQLVDLMANYRFDLAGSMRSMDNLMLGFSISFMLAVIVMGVLGLILVRERVGLVKRVALVDAIWLAVMNAVSLRYFFVIPTSFLVVAFLMFAAAWIKLPAESAGPQKS
jgi:hypothetical protein